MRKSMGAKGSGTRWAAAGSIAALILLLALSRWPAPSIQTDRGVAPLGPTAATHTAVESWPRYPAATPVGTGTGVAVDSQGFIWLLHRAGRTFTNDELIDTPTLLRIDPASGVVVLSTGADLFASPHGLAIDGQDNLWVTDVSLNKVFKLSAEGTVLMTLGRDHSSFIAACIELRTVLVNLPCPLQDDHFARPTDVAVAGDGTVFVSDGYRNARIARFDAQGRYLGSWGQLGNGASDLFLPHGLAIDRAGSLYVADRRNARLQIRSTSGAVVANLQGNGVGRPFGVDLMPDGSIVLADGGDVLDDPSASPRSQLVTIDENGKPRPGWGRYGSDAADDFVAHDVAVARDGSIYLAVLDRQALYKLVPAKPP